MTGRARLRMLWHIFIQVSSPHIPKFDPFCSLTALEAMMRMSWRSASGMWSLAYCENTVMPWGRMLWGS